MNQEKKQLIKQIMGLFLRYGVRSITFDMICRQLSISKKELLSIAKTKEELIAAIFEYREYIAMDIAQSIYTNPQVSNAIDVILQMSVLMSKACTEFNPQLDFEFNKYYPGLFIPYEQKKHSYIIQSMCEQIARGQNEGLFLESLQPQDIASYYLEQVQTHNHSLDEHGLTKQKIELMIQLMTQFMQSICTQRGLLYFNQHKNVLTDLITEWDKKIEE